MHRSRISVLIAGLLAWSGCYSGGASLEGFVATPEGDGPRITWDLEAEPLPEIPFPNDVATRPDNASPTGRRVNASLESKTSFELELRRHLTELDGFGTFAPLWLKFESPDDPLDIASARLDLVNIAARQTGDTRFEDDAILLIDVTAGSPTYGEAQVLDFGSGTFPISVEDPDAYFDNDPREHASNLILEVYDEKGIADVITRNDQPIPKTGDGDDHCDTWEDSNQNGQLDPGEDLDGDGRLDVHEDTNDDGECDAPNLWGTVLDDPTRMHSYHDLISFYELSTNTLQFRPIYPLRERTTYAVVLTDRLVDEAGNPIRSPFEYVHHLQQTEALRPLFEDGLLARYGLQAQNVAFAWTFTTQSVTSGLVRLREGLRGIGPFSHLHDLYPPDIERMVPVSTASGAASLRLRPEEFVSLLKLVFENFALGGTTFSLERVDGLLNTYGAVDYIMAGDYVSPDFLDAAGGVFDIDPEAGTGSHQPNPIRFLLAVPKARYGPKPFPVALYCHGYTSMKLEALLFAGVLAKFGIATFVIDAVSHGLPLGPEILDVLDNLFVQYDAEGLRPFFDAVKVDRARDLNDDLLVEPGGDFWTNDTFHTRDIVRQTVVDYLQAARVLQGFDGTRLWSVDVNEDGLFNDLAGDLDGDGQVDLGGPDVPFYALGTSMGGILSPIIAGVEPAIVATAPMSPGGGLLEVGLRTDLGNVRRAVILPILGPMVITEPLPSDPRFVNISWLVNDVFSDQIEPFARIGGLQGSDVVGELRAGDIVRVSNLRNGEVDEVVTPQNRRIRAHIAADRGDPIVVEIYRPDGTGPRRQNSLIREDATLVKRIDRFEFEIEGFQGRTYEVDEPLVAIREGLGYRRNTSDLRRLLGIAQMILEPADPVNYAPFYRDPLTVRPEGAQPVNALFTLTMGDMTVPVSTGVALARAAGTVGFREDDPRYGKSQNQLLIDTHVIEGIDELHYFRDDCCRSHCGQVNFDIDDLSDGRHPDALPRLAGIIDPPLDCGRPAVCAPDLVCEALPPLRASIRNGEHGFIAVRFPALSPRGQHVIDLPDPNEPFDPSMFTLNQVGLFLASGGTVLSDHPCLAKNDCAPCRGVDSDCPDIPPPTSIEVGTSP